jgi:zinc transport system permease protein
MIADMLAFDFMQRALVGGLMVGLLCAALSFFIVLRRLSFIGVGISHSAFGGLAIGTLLGINPFATAAAFAVMVAWGIGFTSRRGALHEDTTIGIFFSTAMAFGVVLISLSHGYRADLFSLLFGNILAITRQDLLLVAGCTFGVGLFLFLLFKELLVTTFDEEVARVSGVQVELIYYGLLTAMALTIVAAIKVVGVILVEALLVVPAATGYQLSKNFRFMLLFSLLAGALSVLGGLVLSYRFDIPPGATIVLVAACLFLLAFLFSPSRGILFSRR